MKQHQKLLTVWPQGVSLFTPARIVFTASPGAEQQVKISQSIERCPNEKIKLFRLLGKAAGYTLESADSLLQYPGYDPRIVVTET